MRKVIVANLMSLDGVQTDPRSWASAYFDDEAAASSLEQLRSADAMLMGRGTYEYFAPAWPKATGPYADRVNTIRKYVFSSTLTNADWTNSTIVSGDPVKEVAELKSGGTGALVIYGYTRLAQTLHEHDLVDELKFGVHPVMLGTGVPLFRPGRTRELRLADVERKATGVVVLTYERP
jgi:dihydrofolate reductase